MAPHRPSVLAGLLVLAFPAALALPAAPRPLHAQEGAGVPSRLPLKLPPRPTGAAISPADLMTRLYQFADDSMGGRATGSVGHLKSTAYLAAEAERLRLTPAGDPGSYYQVLPLLVRRIEPGSAIQVRARRFEVGREFGVLITDVPGGWLPDSAEVVYGGVLDDTLTQITDAEAAGKLVLLDPDRRTLRLSPASYRLARGARFSRALAVVVPVWESLGADAQRTLLTPVAEPPVPPPAGDLPPHPPTLLVSRALGAALRQVADSGVPGERVGLEIALRESPVARNVVAILPGSDSALNREFVVLGAHSDHDGVRAPSSAAADTIMNGADDDGSGVVALLEIAEALAARPVAPRRSVLLIWHAAEEQGMVGSGWYTGSPTVPLDAMLAMVNLDMVGRGGRRDIGQGGPRYLQVVGSRRRSSELGSLVDSVNAARPTPFRFDYSLDASNHPERIFCRSDHASYARYGIPVVFLSTGLHADYHQPSDEPHRIDYLKLTSVTEYVLDLTLALADRPGPLKLDRKKPDPDAPCRQ
ncbi:MAG: M20/M25/M40 family metallo-hydrolase [Gemmatimonadales bacterium]|nr:M20/M25/M40 family metallo-hydrolase [Gemmatimonadales bacterium]